MKELKVVAAVIFQDGKVFATLRGYGPYKEGWEFPGGKIEAARWLNAGQLDSVDWLPADITLIPKIARLL